MIIQLVENLIAHALDFLSGPVYQRNHARIYVCVRKITSFIHGTAIDSIIFLASVKLTKVRLSRL